MKTGWKIFYLFLFAITAAVVTGCATDNSDDISQVPWNGPANWEGPLPSSINQGR